ncbi:MAG: DNA methyltransferase [Chloroflexia bacterium]
MLASTTATLNKNTPVYDWYLMPEAYSAPIVTDAIEEFGVRRGETVLDPFCGTGTTLVAAKLAGRNALGIEVNPFLCFAGRVKARDDFDLPLLRVESEKLLTQAHAALDRLVDTGPLSLVDDLPDMPRLEQWISRRVVWKVLALRACIEESMSQGVRDVPMLALASLLRGASNMKLSPHAFGSRVVKHDAPVMLMFEQKLKKMIADIEWLEEQKGLGRAEVVERDVRCSGDLEHELLPAALAIGSPPYLNNLDYTMQTRMELFFLGFVNDMEGLKKLRKRMMICDAKATYKEIEDWKRVTEIPTIATISKAIDDKLEDKGWGWDYGRMTRNYFGGLLRAMEAVKPMLAPGAKLVLILGESAHAGVLVPVPDLAAELGKIAGYNHAEVRTMRTRRSSSHSFSLKESAVVLG